MSPIARGATLLAIALLVPACNLTFTSDDPFATSSTPQNPFTLQFPVDGATGVLTSNTQFAWGALAGAQSYELQISETPSFAQVLYDLPNITITSVFIQVGLTCQTTYYWRIFAHGAGPSVLAGGSPYRFTTIGPPFAPPGPFFLQSPVGGPIDRTAGPIFSWTASSGASSYSLQVDVSPFFLTPVVDLSNLHFNEATCPILLAPQTTYNWRVIAINSFGQIDSSPSPAIFSTGP